MIGDLNDFLALLKEMLEGWGVESWVSQIIIGTLAFLFILSIIGKTLYDIFHYFVDKHRKKLTAKDLHPFYSPREIDEATRYYIKTQFQNMPPSDDDEPGRSYIASAKQPLIPLFLNKAFKSGRDDTKYYLVLADSGMGKTTFMINLYLAYKFKKVWFWQKPKHKIKLFPLGNPMSLERIKEMSREEKEDTILLLDAFDEDNKAVENYEARLKEILDSVWEFREVVITCRTQFFPTSKDVPQETGYYKFGPQSGQYNFQRIYISVFSDKDIQKYIDKKFSFFRSLFSRDRDKALAIVLKAPNLMMRPMLLSNIDDIIASGKTIQYGYEIYEILIDKWLDREANKPGIIKKYGKNYKTLLYDFSRALARDLYLNREKRDNKLSLMPNEIIDNPNGLQLKDLEENHIEIYQEDQSSRTLLNRNAVGEYKFSHKSILEYFIANELLLNSEFRGKFSFMNDIDTVKKFLFDILYNNKEIMGIKTDIFINTLGLFSNEYKVFSEKKSSQNKSVSISFYDALLKLSSTKGLIIVYLSLGFTIMSLFYTRLIFSNQNLGSETYKNILLILSGISSMVIVIYTIFRQIKRANNLKNKVNEVKLTYDKIKIAEDKVRIAKENLEKTQKNKK